MSSLEEERREQERWKRLLLRPKPIYDILVEHDFETPEEYRARMGKNLGVMLGFAARQVPHYNKLFRNIGVEPDGGFPFETLTALPVMTKLDAQDAGKALFATNLPQGDRRDSWWTSSGTTGRPFRTLHSTQSTRMLPLLAQRSARWHRLDPLGTCADMRIPHLLPLHPTGRELLPGEAVRLETWRDLHQDFATGPYLGISVMTPVEERIAWLRRVRPDYLMAYAGTLELLAMATDEELPAPSLKAVVAISEQLTPSMRSFVERRFKVPVHQVYGLTEFGLVAVRCEAGRYHVHREQCLVEILDKNGRPCAPGETGFVIVTGLRNFAMPLLRYNTGDLAEATGGHCPCNRTLPSFGEIIGRYGRIAHLPPGTMLPVLALREAIEGMPDHIMRGLREFQIHQYADRRMELRLVSRLPLSEAFYAHIRAAWAKATNREAPELAIVSVEEIAKTGGKSEVFTSDFAPPRDGKPSAPGTANAGKSGRE